MKMKKQICTFILLVLAGAGLAGCRNAADELPETGETTLQTESGVASQPDKPDTGYLAVECYEATGFDACHFCMEDHTTALTLRLPRSWTLIDADNGGGYTILRDGFVIGRIYTSDTICADTEICLLQEQLETGETPVETCVLKATNGTESGYLRRLRFTYLDEAGTQSLVLETDYAELSAFSLNKMAFDVETPTTEKTLALGSLKQFGANGRGSILILGNSFINSSQVGSILDAMCQTGGSNVSIDAISRGYATVTSYVEGEDYLHRIEARNYGVVFMCGFYGSSDVTNFQYLVEVCKASNTLLVIFPAHNEQESLFQSAYSKWKDEKNVFFLNWKGEIDDLIRYQDVDTWDFCKNDQHRHSTPLAGYVGAQMIYAALFGQLPPSISYGAMTTASARAYLGEYMDTGSIQVLSEQQIHRFCAEQGR